MEAKFCIDGHAAQSNAVKFYYSKRKESISEDQRRSAGSRQLLCSAPPQPAGPAPCRNDELEVGAFYEIDHEKLPPKSPIQLKAVRVVKVSETTKLDVTVSFPSSYSLRNYFSSLHGNKGGQQYQIPELDERFVMSTNHAGKILRRLLTASQMNGEKHLQSFWLVVPFLLVTAAAAPKAPAAAVVEEVEEADQASKTALQPLDGLQSALKFSGRSLEWGVRRKVSYMGRQQQQESLPPSPKTEDDAGETLGMEVEEEEEVQNVIFTRKRARDACKENNKNKNKKEKWAERKEMKKRKKKPRHEIKEEKKATMNKETNESRRGRGGSKERWSAERYESAELKLLDIMREKRAVLGNPILRLQLREEARKHIGDTGLLDHLLKHMSGKVVSEGAEVFRRRHNAQGAMEYWLEPKELDEARRKAGLMDPYWLPPPGWKPGDAIATSSASSCGAHQCQKEVTQMKEEIRILKRDVGDLHDLKQLEKYAKEDHHLSQAAAYSVLQGNYEGLAEKNTKLEEEVAVLVNTVKELKEEIGLLKQYKDKKKKEEEKPALAADQVEKKKNSNGINEVDLGGVAVGKKRGSGFRICKPQGTFLWPNIMMAGGGITTSCNNVNVNVNDGSSSSPAAIFSTMSSPNTMISTITTASINGGDAVVVPAATKSMEQLQKHKQLATAAMVFGGGGGGAGGIPTPPSCSSSTTAAPKLLALPIPSPTTPKSSTSSSPAPPASQQLPRAHARDLMMQQQLLSVQVVNPRHQQQDKIAAAARASAAAGDHRHHQMKGGHEDVHVSAAWSTITTDLVLATPSPSYSLNLN